MCAICHWRPSRRFLVSLSSSIVTILATDYGIAPERISLLGSFDLKAGGDEIEDPINQDSVEFDRCYARLRDCIVHYLDTTTEIPHPPDAPQTRPQASSQAKKMRT